MPNDLLHPLHVTLILLIASVAVIGLFRSLNLSSILGYLIVGTLLGPHALGWLPDTEHTRLLAEMGVVFLLFTVGLEFSIPVLFASRHIVLGLGGAQVALTALLAGTLAWRLDLAPAVAFVVGGAIAMSSTAIVIRQLSEQMELNMRHGRLAVGMLLFQDLASLPFLLLLPKLAAGAGFFDAAVLLALIKGAAVFALLAVIGRRIVRPLFRWIAGRRSPELFMLTALLTVLGAAALAHTAGLSPPLGAFLAGMVLGETEFRHQIEDDVRPFREVLLGLFFITIGMALNPAVLKTHLPMVLGFTLVILSGKALIIGLLARAFGEHPAVAARTSLSLCQAGEFGLLLVSMGLSLKLLPPGPGQLLLAAQILSMIAAPVLIRHNQALVKHATWLRYHSRQKRIEENVAAVSAELSRHVVIVGYGRMGQNLGQLLNAADRPYIAIDLDIERTGAARAAGNPVVYGDASREALLRAAGVERATALVVTPERSELALKILHHARQLNPDIAILVRTRDDASLDALLDAGATEVLPEVLESSLIAGTHLLRLLNVPDEEIEALVARVRAERYEPLRRWFHGKQRGRPGDAHNERLESVTLSFDAFAVGRSLQELDLDRDDVKIMSVVRNGVHIQEPFADIVLREGDVLVLSGEPAALKTAEKRLRHG